VEREVHIISNAAVHEPVIIFVLQEGLAGAIYGYKIDRSCPRKKSCGGGGGGGGDQLATIISLEPKKRKRAVHSHYSAIGLGPESKVYQRKGVGE
jgi:hypothetical protein